jgi:hypothetical protein
LTNINKNPPSQIRSMFFTENFYKKVAAISYCQLNSLLFNVIKNLVCSKMPLASDQQNMFVNGGKG